MRDCHALKFSRIKALVPDLTAEADVNLGDGYGFSIDMFIEETTEFPTLVLKGLLCIFDPCARKMVGTAAQQVRAALRRAGSE